VRGVRERVDMIASTPAAFSLERRLAGETQRETILARRLRGLTGYDAAVIDLLAGDESAHLQRAALRRRDHRFRSAWT